MSAVDTNDHAGAAAPSLEAMLSAQTVWRAGRAPAAPAGGEPTGHAALDALLPQGGWPRRALTELLLPGDGVGELSLLLPTIARMTQAGGVVAVVAPPYLPYAPAWQAAGVDLRRLEIVEADARGALWAFEQCLRSAACAAVLGWPAQADAQALRRLQVAADSGDCLGFAFRDRRHAANPSPAALRLEHAGGAWRVRKCRGGNVPAEAFVPGDAGEASAALVRHPGAGEAPVARIRHPRAGKSSATLIRHPRESGDPMPFVEDTQSLRVADPSGRREAIPAFAGMTIKSRQPTPVRHPRAGESSAISIRHPRESGDPAAFAVEAQSPWVPACAGMTGKSEEWASWLTPIRHPRAGKSPATLIRHPRESGDPVPFVEDTQSPRVADPSGRREAIPAFAGMTIKGRQPAPVRHPRAGESSAISIRHPRESGDPAAFAVEAQSPWVPACAGMTGKSEEWASWLTPIRQPRAGKTPATLIRHPRESGDPVAFAAENQSPWIPACAGMTSESEGMPVTPIRHPRESGDPVPFAEKDQGPWIPACAGMTGKGASAGTALASAR